MVNALATSVQLDPSIIALRISGKWDPATTSFEALLSNDPQEKDFYYSLLILLTNLDYYKAQTKFQLSFLCEV